MGETWYWEIELAKAKRVVAVSEGKKGLRRS
jgi:hypothetical protein